MIDWRDEKTYPEKLASLGWAWEFLRRNKQYQQDYARWSNATSNHSGAHPSSPLLPYEEHLRREEDRSITWYDPPRREDESLGDWEERCRKDRVVPQTFTPTEWMRHRWQLARPGNPDLACNDDVIFFKPRFPAEVTYKDFDGYFEERKLDIDDDMPDIDSYVARKDQYAVIAFDLNQPLAPQVHRAKKMLKEFATTQPKGKNIVTDERASELRNQLRVLDGLAAGATLREIAAFLFPEDLKMDNPIHGEQHVSDVKRSAEKMVEQGYTKLVFWPSD